MSKLIIVHENEEILLNIIKVLYAINYQHIDGIVITLSDELVFDYDWNSGLGKPKFSRVYDAKYNEYTNVLRCNSKTGLIMKEFIRTDNTIGVELIYAPAPLIIIIIIPLD